MTTQMAETPTLFGNDAQAVLKQITSKPSKRQIDQIKSNLENKFSGIETTRKEVVESLEQSLKEMKDIRAGKKKGKSWRELYSELHGINTTRGFKE